MEIYYQLKQQEKEQQKKKTIKPFIYRQRPIRIDKRILLPISTNEAERVIGTAKYVDGVVALRIPIPKATTVPIT
jgi:hypothetical protein